MKQLSVIALSGVFATCICVVLAVPLHACEQSVKHDSQAAVPASEPMDKGQVKKHTSIPNKAKVEAVHRQMPAHETAKAAKSPVATPVASVEMVEKKAVPEKKTQAKVGKVDFKVLKERLTHTDAIGFFTKLAIRNDIVDLMDKIKQYRKKSILKEKMKEIRASFDGLLLKIIALLEEDPDLSHDLYVGRESIWESLLEVKA